ncbi:MAG: hypothetical protein K6G07_05365 [Lachnospiraceae bacterium]|nr:hypothetical protein [Lachnospiraceae bacterium]
MAGISGLYFNRNMYASSLFNNTNSSTSGVSSLSSLLTDYSSIKTGAYGKLMSAYYAQNTADTSSTAEAETEAADKTKSTYDNSGSYSSASDMVGTLYSSYF